MKIAFYTIVFIAAAAIGAQAEKPHYTMTNGCVSIKVPTVIYQETVEAGLFEFMENQCVVVS